MANLDDALLDPNSQGFDSSNCGTLYGVGVGPGDPQLLTLKALNILKKVDFVFAPAVDLDTPGRAESILNAVDDSIKVKRLKMSIDQDALASYSQNSILIADLLKSNSDVAIITLGDPNLYSSFNSYYVCLKELIPELTVVTIPGIMAFQDLAARTNTMLADNDDKLYLVSCVNEIDFALDLLKESGTSLIIYKGGKYVLQIKNAAMRNNRIQNAVIGNHLGLEDESYMKLSEFELESASYLATVIIPSTKQ